MTIVQEIENRFLEICGLDLDLSVFPLPINTPSQPRTDKDKSKEHGEVFTPLWLVDQMILKATVEKLHQAKSTLDLCAGYGQFTVRMIRALANYDPKFRVNKWLKENHTLIELQLESAHSLLYIFGTDINLFIGDATEFKKIRKDKGIFFYKGYWEEVSQIWIRKYMHQNETIFINRFTKKFLRKQEEGVLTI
jgi:hypothetical protein